ncbi:hypothetical protein [Ancylobacter pratisalsi]|uniref:Uncharacterized protein n=1 Tax=Ancylobacter pratisalsi TaxID=1745854 RepID=A0A6P1YGI7_9HYPH|nr:hypothetical protein [Ancylobacter pratisalsi]QIB32399.1 hypothetical protein G3A50_00785 [Ancylobacter pratisalsi]
MYLSIVPGVRITDICAGAGLGAAVMWAINEWETGKWNVPVTAQTMALAAQAVAVPAAQAQAAPAQAAPAQAAVAAGEAAAVGALPPEQQAAAHSPEPRPRVDSGVATAETLEKWEIDEKEPGWDPSALAETWAKLRRELSSAGPKRASAVAADLPRTAQLAKGPIPGMAQPAASRSTRAYNPTPAQPVTAMASASVASASAASGRQTLSSKLASATSTGSSAKPVTASYTVGGSYGAGSLSSSMMSPPAGTLRKTAGAAEPSRAPAFLRPGTSRPR